MSSKGIKKRANCQPTYDEEHPQLLLEENNNSYQTPLQLNSLLEAYLTDLIDPSIPDHIRTSSVIGIREIFRKILPQNQK